MRFRDEDATLQSDDPVWFLTHNRDKFREAVEVLAPFKVKVRHLNRSKVEIQDTRQENIAKFSLLNALKEIRKPIVVEDSGIFIEDLDGFPGPYSSFVYDTIGLGGVLAILRRYRARKAFFQATVAFGSPTVKPHLFIGKVKGRISTRVLGRKGFGYDPIFIPEGSNSTFGESTQALKNRKSHRAKAFKKFARWFVAQRQSS